MIDVRAPTVRRGAVEFYKLLERKNFDIDRFIVIGGAALVLYGLLEETSDIDIITGRKSLYRLKRLRFRSCEKTSTVMRIRKDNINYEIGLPGEFDLAKPWYMKERIAIEDAFVNLRPKRLLKADCEIQLKIAEDLARSIHEEPTVFESYVKYKTRLERLSGLNH